ncbi:MAG: MBL fold metallo-hydrolase [Desulfosalsimonadaceae bacterium]
MDVKQIFLPRMANFCYMLGDEATGTCAVIDPAFDAKKIRGEIDAAGYRITHVINTHGHADHVSANADIIKATGATLCIHGADASQMIGFFNRSISRLLGGKGSPAATRTLSDGDIISVGKTDLRIIHTPGHTPGSVCIYADGHLFTGDTLFVGAVGRTDLPGGSFETLITSIHEKLYTLPDATVVWPGHDYGDSPSSTIGREKADNPFT